ncbi:MAG: GNAT family N-acetyltransferase, partial [Parachlamydiaceae bacterium]|nr:GNAT family N-acetyltransferase [Parachlamydiaceae bacterium]
HETLKKHFLLFFELISEYKLVPNAHFEKINTVYRSLTGIPFPYNNAIIGVPDTEDNWDQFISQQLDYFNALKIPFVWYIDEASNLEFKEMLKSYNFKDIGIFQGVIGSLNHSILGPEISNDSKLERVKNEKTLEEFNDLVCATFEINGVSKAMYKKVLWKAMLGNKPMMSHWIARKEGKAVSAVSTLIKDEIVSFWNGATIPEFRRQGYSTALRHLALKDALAKGCHTGISYLMAEGLALGICKKLGYKTNWRFHALVAPINNIMKTSKK